MSTPGEHEAPTITASSDHWVEVDGPDAVVPDRATATLPQPPRTRDPRVDSILSEFVTQSADSEDLSVRLERATTAHRQLQARLSADREH